MTLNYLNKHIHFSLFLSGGGWWRWALVSPDGVAPSRMVCVSASVNRSLHREVQKFSSGTGSPGWSRKKGHKTVVVWWFVPECKLEHSYWPFWGEPGSSSSLMGPLPAPMGISKMGCSPAGCPSQHWWEQSTNPNQLPGHILASSDSITPLPARV